MKLIAILCGALVIAAPADAKPGKWQRIFDGRTLKGWTPKITGAAAGENLGNSFTVANRAIRVTYEGWSKFDGRFGHLAYNRPVGAFRLRFQYRFFGKTLPDVEDWQHSNSAAMLLGQSPHSMGRDQKFPVSVEMQLLGADRPNPEPSGNLCTPGTNVVIDGGRLVRVTYFDANIGANDFIADGRRTDVLDFDPGDLRGRELSRSGGRESQQKKKRAQAKQRLRREWVS